MNFTQQYVGLVCFLTDVLGGSADIILDLTLCERNRTHLTRKVTGLVWCCYFFSQRTHDKLRQVSVFPVMTWRSSSTDGSCVYSMKKLMTSECVVLAICNVGLSKKIYWSHQEPWSHIERVCAIKKVGRKLYLSSLCGMLSVSRVGAHTFVKCCIHFTRKNPRF